jgi:hypothetical protein
MIDASTRSEMLSIGSSNNYAPLPGVQMGLMGHRSNNIHDDCSEGRETTVSAQFNALSVKLGDFIQRLAC